MVVDAHTQNDGYETIYNSKKSVFFVCLFVCLFVCMCGVFFLGGGGGFLSFLKL